METEQNLTKNDKYENLAMLLLNFFLMDKIQKAVCHVEKSIGKSL